LSFTIGSSFILLKLKAASSLLNEEGAFVITRTIDF
jgi:hypothetical protein